MAKAAGGKKKVFRKKEKKNIPVGIVHIAASFNNTLISITDLEGNLIAQSSCGLARLPRLAQGHSVRGTAGSIRSGEKSARSGHAAVRSAGEGSGRRPRIGDSGDC